MKKIPGIILTLTGAMAAAGGVILKKTDKAAASVSIIGGADGPTSVFVAGNVGSGTAFMVIAAGAAFVAAGLFLLLRKG